MVVADLPAQHQAQFVALAAQSADGLPSKTPNY
jgi:hypothetical protein